MNGNLNLELIERLEINGGKLFYPHEDLRKNKNSNLTMRYWDKQGNLIHFDQWCALQRNPLYRNIGKDVYVDHLISTIWWGAGIFKDKIFETVVLNPWDNEIFGRCYSSIENAREGHKEAIEWIKYKLNPTTY